MKNLDRVISRFLDTFDNYKSAVQGLHECFDDSEIMNFYEKNVKFVDPKLMTENERDSLIETFVKAYTFNGQNSNQKTKLFNAENQNDNNQLEKVEQLVRDYVIAEDETKDEVLNVLQKINGAQRGLKDFYGYYVSGNFNYSLNDIVNEIIEENELEKESSNSL